VIPIVNENDTVSTDEIRLGDNDTLASLVLGLVGADVLAILTDQQGLYDANPRENPFAKLIHQAPVTDQTLEQMASPKGGLLGSGGMRTKVLAAKKAASFGGHTLIASGREEQVLIRLAQGEELGTWLVCNVPPMAGRKQWLNSHVQVVGRLKLDAGAVKALLAHKSLLPVGVLDSIGQYERGDMVACIDEAGTEIARGVINYSSRETHKIKGVSSERIEALLGYVDEFELIHKDNLILKVDLPQA
jgi:glutamate 5-kinase